LQILIGLVVALKVEIAALLKVNIDLLAIIKVCGLVNILAVVGIYI